ncbi:MAG: bifunctional 23S rRNA (guanine(2069)-N(7))-methyltransferase RlmK/23S rRNA (guanine(2445)-N(2))-methyltransferase RlmL [Methylococcaceae bacterium]|nr:bifunctional 23S rRNA (guanine(2069)-N(7))-methyltransferase RlmK/23S rRNA (guanine(2445)-N(2))-methyltransferase RlmL [Methylococcaceae bacterium]
MTKYQLFATTPKAMEDILAEELKQLGAENVHPKLAGVTFQGDLEMAYRTCLWSRTANRILLPLSSFQVTSKEDLYEAVKKINWFEHFKPDETFAVSFSAKNSVAINNSHFGSLVVKDAIVDQMRAKFHKRPNVDLNRPTIKINVYLNAEDAQLSLDLSGESLHKRGYREANVQAPIKENLAAAMLLRSGWPKIAKKGGSLIDPMCGSGTLLLEAAMIAADYAPGLLRKYYGFVGWKQHDVACWQKILSEAEQRKNAGLEQMPVIAGFDQSRRTVATAIKHVENAGFQNKIHVEKRDINDAEPASSWQPGLLICNPPYGERLGDEEQITQLYRQFGDTLKAKFIGWKASIIISNPEMGFRLGIRSQKPITLYNGALECKLLRLTIEEKSFFVPKARSQQERIEQISQSNSSHTNENQSAEMFANRLKKNLKKMNKWAKQQNISCYRIYDADLPEYAVAVDFYQGEKLWVNVQEYEAPKTIAPHKANERLAGVLAEIPRVLKIDNSQVFLKIRRKQKNTNQYEKHDNKANFHVIEENNCKFLVNFEDYLDTGLFLDHRPIRQKIQQQAKGKHFLNLFAYTATASIHAALGGAISTTTVDMSNTYLDWAQKNFDLNNLAGNNKIIRADCSTWLEQEAKKTNKTQYDLIFLDPPTFSNSKRMEDAFDIQQDHVALIKNALALLTPAGTLYFSTNFRKFKLDEQAFSAYVVENITALTIPEDFARTPKIHYCWKFLKQ